MAFNIFKDGTIMSVMMVPGNRVAPGGMEFHFARHDGKGTAVALGPVALAEMVRVFRGECESMRDGKGIRDCGKTFNLDHTVEPQGYRVSVKRDGGERFVVSMDYAEALVLSLVIEHSMSSLLFGEGMA